MIKSLSIENFKIHKSTNLNLRNLNVLTGQNSSGKSSIIQILLLLRQSYLKSELKDGLQLQGDLCNIGLITDALCKYADENSIKIRLVDCSPTYNECVHIDKFFDVYGYQVNTINKISNVMKTRNNYNYIQVKQSNIKLNGIQSDLQQLNAIFENGVTVWHNFENFGNYGVDNI